MILSGEKKEEYREIKYHWIQRLCKEPWRHHPLCHGLRDFDSIIFSNGYAKNRDQFEIELKEIDVNTEDGNPEWGAEPGKQYFVLKLGEVIS